MIRITITHEKEGSDPRVIGEMEIVPNDKSTKEVGHYAYSAREVANGIKKHVSHGNVLGWARQGKGVWDLVKRCLETATMRMPR